MKVRNIFYHLVNIVFFSNYLVQRHLFKGGIKNEFTKSIIFFR